MIETIESPDARTVGQLLRVCRLEEAHSGRRPLDESHRVALENPDAPGNRRWLLDRTRTSARTIAAHPLSDGSPELTAFAVSDADTAEIAAVDDAGATRVLTALLGSRPGICLWTHGDRSRGRAAAEAAGMALLRRLDLLARGLPFDAEPRPMPAGVSLERFDAVADADEWLSLNRSAFADLPDQGRWTRTDLDERLHAEWFDERDFLIARAPDGTMAGFHWMKLDPGALDGDERSGEVFVIGVSPQWRGTGLAPALLEAGLTHLTQRGLHRAHLFVDSDNERAIALYRRSGFRRVDSDRQYALTAHAPHGRTAGPARNRTDRDAV